MTLELTRCLLTMAPLVFTEAPLAQSGAVAYPYGASPWIEGWSIDICKTVFDLKYSTTQAFRTIYARVPSKALERRSEQSLANGGCQYSLQECTVKDTQNTICFGSSAEPSLRLGSRIPASVLA